MYTLVRRFIKTGIAFLFLGLLLGAWMLVQRDLLGSWPNPYLVRGAIVDGAVNTTARN